MVAEKICEKKVLKDLRKADIWAVGLVFYNIITFYRPFDKFPINKDNDETDQHFEERKQKVLNQMKSDSLFDDLFSDLKFKTYENKTINEEMIDLLKQLLNPSEKDRKLLKEVINHRFLDKDIKRPKSFYRSRRMLFREGMKSCFRFN